MGNHREFVVMCATLLFVGVSGCILDFCVIGLAVWDGQHKDDPEMFAHIGLSVWDGQRKVGPDLLLHLAYSIAMSLKVGAILKIHIGLISRNELAYEWTHEANYVVTSARTGRDEPVIDLSDDEREARQNSFRYDNRRNLFDKGTKSNCWVFWCTPRCDDAESGAF